MSSGIPLSQTWKDFFSHIRIDKRVEELFKGGERIPTPSEKGTADFEFWDGIDIEYINISDAETLKELDYIQDKDGLTIACQLNRTKPSTTLFWRGLIMFKTMMKSKIHRQGSLKAIFIRRQYNNRWDAYGAGRHNSLWAGSDIQRYKLVEIHHICY